MLYNSTTGERTMRKVVLFEKGFAFIVVGLLICSGLGLIPTQTQATIGKSGYDFIIITPAYFSNELQPLVTHKEQHMITTKIITLDEIYDSVYFPAQGRDDAEKIKYFIKNAFDTWNITYVLFVGGRKYGSTETWYFPVRYVENELFMQKTYLSDLYFADLYNDQKEFQSWDTNNDGVFGTQDEEMDLHPDVYVGRWACRNKIEVRTVVKKTIEYESTIGHSNKIILVGGDSFEDSKEYDEGELITNESGNCLLEYEKIKIYSSQKNVSPKEIRKALDEGAAFMHFNGHGFVIYWTTYHHKQIEIDAEPGLGIWDIVLFSNTQYPIVVVGGCETGMFNVAVTYRPYTWAPERDLPMILRFFPAVECISWYFTSKSGGGSVASLGYTCSTLGAASEHGDKDHDGITEPDCIEAGYGFMEINFFSAHGNEKKSFLGECWGYAIDTYYDTLGKTDIGDLRNIQSFILFGDPSLKIGGYF